jgi:8-oxo-dGTP pyrophosphatase MutT (NUDIX family)
MHGPGRAGGGTGRATVSAMLLRVVAAAVVHDARLLVVSKTGAPDVYYLPGGKPDPGEAELSTLTRELAEELRVVPVRPVPYLVIEASAALEGVPMLLSVYRCALSAPPAAAAEIAALGWTTGTDGYRPRLAPAVRDVLVPRLCADGLLVA